MKTQIIKAFIPAILAIVVLSVAHLLPTQPGIAKSCMRPDMPLGYALHEWKGVKTQESELERKILSPDTQFSKAYFTQLPRVPWEKPTPAINVSIVYSGQDLNNSIHRPEVCLPAQGHLNVQGSSTDIKLSNGKTLRFTRLSSVTPLREDPKKRINHIHYYVFVGCDTILHTHVARNIQDMMDRVLYRRVQSWAYFQAGTYWAPELGLSEKDADARLRKLISELLPRQIDWEQVK